MTYIQHSISCVSKLFNTPKSLNLDITRESESFQSFDNLYKTWDWLDIVSPYCGDSGRWSVSLATLGDRWCVLVPWLCDYQHQATQPPGTAIHIHVYTHHGSGLCWCCSNLHTADGHHDLPEQSECDQNQCWSFRDTSPRAASRLQAADCVQEQSKTLAATWALLSPYTGLQTTLQLVLTTRISIPFLQSTTHI